MKRIFLIIACMVLMAGMAWANDAEYYATGNQLVPLKQTTIRVTKEVLSIDLRDDGTAYVDVQYEFTNPESKAKTILMGFEADPPYSSEGDIHYSKKHPFIKNFTVEVNGQKLKYKNAISRPGKFNPINTKGMYEDDGLLKKESDPYGGGIPYAYVYHFNATFQPGVNKVHHTYSYRMVEAVNWVYQLDYKLSPAARWANKQIDDFTLIVSANKTAKHFSIPYKCLGNVKPEICRGKGKVRATTLFNGEEKEKSWEVSLRKGAVKFHIKNFKPSAKHELRIEAMTNCFGDNGGDDRLGHSYDRSALGVSYLYCIDKGGYSNKFVELVIHNLPYAHRGRVFKTKGLQKFFNSCWWYMPDPKYVPNTKDFTKTDWEYVNFKYEDK